jgi:hypothetical protein
MGVVLVVPQSDGIIHYIECNEENLSPDMVSNYNTCVLLDLALWFCPSSQPGELFNLRILPVSI